MICVTCFAEIKQTLMDRRRQLEFSIYPYESHTRKLVSKLMDMKELANNYLTDLNRLETYRWSVGIGKPVLLGGLNESAVRSAPESGQYGFTHIR